MYSRPDGGWPGIFHTIGYKTYPRRWWLPILKMLFHQQGLTRLVALSHLETWVNEGKKKAKELKGEWAGSGLQSQS